MSYMNVINAEICVPDEPTVIAMEMDLYWRAKLMTMVHHTKQKLSSELVTYILSWRYYGQLELHWKEVAWKKCSWRLTSMDPPLCDRYWLVTMCQEG